MSGAELARALQGASQKFVLRVYSGPHYEHEHADLRLGPTRNKDKIERARRLRVREGYTTHTESLVCL